MLKPIRLTVMVLMAVLFACGASRAESVPRGKLPEGVTPLHYWLDFDIVPSEERFSGKARITVSIERTTSVIWMHSRGQDASAAYVTLDDGTRVNARFHEIEESGIAKFEPESPIDPGTVTLVIEYTAPFDQSLEGLYQVRGGGNAYAYTQFQPLAARKAFPGFDEPRFKTPFDISITAKSEHGAISNALAKQTIDLGNGQKRVMFETTDPLPTYLVALAVGDFDVVEWADIPPNAIRPHPVPLRGIATRGKGAQLTYALKHTAALLEILEEYFGEPYPYSKIDIVAPAEFKSGGMENVGAIFYREDIILFEESPSIFQRRTYASIHAHELAHSWFGNLVTPAWWDDLWLNEAFATWMADRVTHAWKPEEFAAHRPVRTGRRAIWSDRLVSARQIRQPVETEGDVVNAFDSITYSKGGGVLAMIERYVGADVFRSGVRRFIDGHRHGVATADEFIHALSQAAGDPGVIEAFRSFLEQPGTPLLRASLSCKSDGTVAARLRQSRALPLGSKGGRNKRWSIPLCLSFQEGDGRGRSCTLVRDEEMEVPLPAKSCPAWLLPNEAGAAYMNYTLPDDGWAELVNRLHDLEPGEALGLIGSIHAAYEGGLVGTELVLRAAKAAAQSRHFDVASAPMQVLRDIKNFFVPRPLRPTAVERLREIYKPALDQFDLSDAALAGEAESSDQALLRADLMWFMALDADDPELRSRLTDRARAYIGFRSDRPADRTALHPNLVRIALMTAAGDEGLPFVEALISLMRETDNAVLRGHIIRALGYQTDPTIVKRVWAVILNPETPRWVASQLLRRQSHRVDNREAVFEFITTRFDQLRDRLPHSHIAWLPWRSSAFCDAESRNKVKAFWDGRIDDYRGGRRALTNVLELIDICIGIVSAQSADAEAAIRSGG